MINSDLRKCFDCFFEMIRKIILIIQVSFDDMIIEDIIGNNKISLCKLKKYKFHYLYYDIFRVSYLTLQSF